ncbi:FeoB-associated Cys-rich membrane protein [Bizionia sediminis]|uniref:FeoB-associated Cys-rich membrane protein n=1 Tax=Bizionia sediminis TaxID=1737064 RepID=A0ABW5KRV0_9FLAO
MNTIIQDIAAFTILGLAVLFLIRKFFGIPGFGGRKKTKNCGSNSNCDCH